MKFIFELIIATVIIFFLWNILKRLFFSSLNNFVKSNQPPQNTAETTKKSVDAKINWDAETVDYEEIKDKSEPNK